MWSYHHRRSDLIIEAAQNLAFLCVHLDMLLGKNQVLISLCRTVRFDTLLVVCTHKEKEFRYVVIHVKAYILLQKKEGIVNLSCLTKEIIFSSELKICYLSINLLIQ